MSENEFEYKERKTGGGLDPRTEKVVDRFLHAADYRKDKYEDLWQQCYDYYRFRKKGNSDKNRANLFIPEIFTIIETEMPRLASPFINPKRKIISVLGREEHDHSNAETVEALLAYDFERTGAGRRIDEFYRYALIYGTGIAKVYWEFNDDASYERPLMEVLDLYDVYVDPEAEDVDDARYVIHRKFLSIEELKERNDGGVYKNVDLIKSGDGRDDGVNPELFDDLYDYGIFEGDRREVEILEHWEDGQVTVIANREFVLRDEKNPFKHGKKPFVKVNFIRDLKKFYGIGAVEPLIELQEELNTKRNQRLDNVNLILNKMWMVVRGAADPEQFRSRPGGIITVKDLGGIREVPMSDVTGSSYREESITKQDIQNVSGVSEYIRGGSAAWAPKVTATEARGKQMQAESRFDYNFRSLADQGVVRIAELFVKLNQQFAVDKKVIRVVGDGVKFPKIKPKDIAGDFDFKVAPDPTGAAESEKIDRYLKLLDLVMRVAKEGLADPMPITKKLADSLEIDESIISETFKKDSPSAAKEGKPPKGMPPGMPPGMMPGMPQEMPPGMMPGMAPPPGQGMPPGMPPDGAPPMPPGMAPPQGPPGMAMPPGGPPQGGPVNLPPGVQLPPGNPQGPQLPQGIDPGMLSALGGMINGRQG